MSTSPNASGDAEPHNTNMQSRLRSLYQAHKPDIKITLRDRRPVYSTLDRIEGNVSIITPVDTSFDEIKIELVGTSRTYVERLTTAAAISGRSEAFHQFLKLEQPSLEQYWPTDKVLKAGQTYNFSFLFVVPEQNVIRVCQHKVVSPAIRDAHLQLPPSFGDKDAEVKSEALDDMVPEMASIRYGVFARISKVKEQDGELQKTTIASKATRLRIIPATEEQPPLVISQDKDSDYAMRKERTIRKGMLQGKLGTLIVEASQPPAMPMKAHGDEEHQSSMATIVLRFDPVDAKAEPPRLSSLATRIKVCTYFASTARQTFPWKQASLQDLSQGLHSEQVNLSTRCVAEVKWEKHDAQRRDSACSNVSMDGDATPVASESYKGKCYYTAKVLVPISLPSRKAWVPTFHSCLISRTYVLKLELGMHTGSVGGTIDLRVPLQITCHTGGNDSPRRHSSIESPPEMITDDEEVGEYFDPRTIHVPDAHFTGRSRIGSQAPLDDAPPGYSFFAPHAGGQRVAAH